MRGEIEFDTLLAMIVVLLVIIGVAAAGVAYMKSAERDKYLTLCKETTGLKSVYLTQTRGVSGTAREKALATVGVKDVNLICPMRIEKIDTTDINTAHAKIATHLKECWEKTSGNKNKLSIETTNMGNTYCIICSRLNSTMDVPLLSLKDFLSKTTIPNGMTGQTYSKTLDTVWGSDVVNKIFIDPQGEMTYPFPGKTTLVEFPKISANQNYDVVDINIRNGDAFQSHIVMVPTSKTQLLACSELHYELPAK